jgi:hypothetical protein
MFGFIDRVVIPTLVIFLLLGGVGGVLLGAALVWRTTAALRFMAQMNRWVSTRRALRVLETPRTLQAVTPRVRRWLGAFLVFGGAFSVAFLLARLDVLQRGSYAPGINLGRWLFSGIMVHTTKWVLVTGSAFAFAVGVLMVFFPARLAAFEARMDRWYSSRRVLDAGETMHTPLEPRVEAHPRAAGSIIAVACLLVAVAMAGLLFGKLK